MEQTHALHAPQFVPARHRTSLQIWLLAVAALVFLMVSIGGATRLTGSGLSITEWQPIMGAVPPLSQADWEEAFSKYQQIPQYHHVNRGMSLDAFKAIFWWEWVHRFLGRLIGAVFFVPLIFFLIVKRLDLELLGKLSGIFVLGGLQGAIGWYMVSSGLADRIDVSQYRLALHLGLAILILGALIWVALSVNGTQRPRSDASLSSVRGAAAIVVLVFLQILLGAFVAGLKAGASYNTWPLMEGHLVPDGLGAMQPWYLNMFENALTVQFDHRVVAYVLLLVSFAHIGLLLRRATDWEVRFTALALGVGIVAQAGLGIATLLTRVPLSLGLAHQAGAAAVFALAVWHLHALYYRRDQIGSAA